MATEQATEQLDKIYGDFADELNELLDGLLDDDEWVWVQFAINLPVKKKSRGPPGPGPASSCRTALPSQSHRGQWRLRNAGCPPVQGPRGLPAVHLLTRRQSELPVCRRLKQSRQERPVALLHAEVQRRQWWGGRPVQGGLRIPGGGGTPFPLPSRPIRRPTPIAAKPERATIHSRTAVKRRQNCISWRISSE